MTLWLLKAGSDSKPGSIVPPKNRGCRSVARKNDSHELERYGSPAVRIPKLEEKSCCKFVPLTFPSKRSRSGKFRNFTRNPAGNDKDAADWISEVIKDIDPLVEIDPVTMARHLAAAGGGESGSGVRKKSLVSGSQQPLTYYFSSPISPGGVPRFVVAVGALVVLVILATTVHLFRIREKAEENVANYESSSDEEGKLDLLSIVDDDEKVEVVKQDGSPSYNRSNYNARADQQNSFKHDEEILRILDHRSWKTRNKQQTLRIPPQFVCAAAVATLAMSDEFQQAFKEHQRPSEAEAFEADDFEEMTLEELMLEEQNIARMDQPEGTETFIKSTYLPQQQQDVTQGRANLVISIPREQDSGELLLSKQEADDEQVNTEPQRTPEYLELQKPGEAGVQVNTDGEAGAQVNTEPQRTLEYLELQKPGEAGVQQELSDDLTAPFSSLEEVDESNDPFELQRKQEALIKQREVRRKLEFLALAAFVFVFSGIPKTELDPGEDGFADPELRKKIVQAALPAVAVGAGALSVVTGVEGAFEMIGFTATAGFIYYELLWAESRRDLWQDVRNINDHKKLAEFLKSKNIVG